MKKKIQNVVSLYMILKIYNISSQLNAMNIPHTTKKKSINDCLYSLLHYSVFGITVLKNEADANQMLSRW